MELHTFRYPNLLSAILGEIFSIRFQPHQAMCLWPRLWGLPLILKTLLHKYNQIKKKYSAIVLCTYLMQIFWFWFAKCKLPSKLKDLRVPVALPKWYCVHPSGGKLSDVQLICQKKFGKFYQKNDILRQTFLHLRAAFDLWA